MMQHSARDSMSSRAKGGRPRCRAFFPAHWPLAIVAGTFKTREVEPPLSFPPPILYSPHGFRASRLTASIVFAPHASAVAPAISLSIAASGVIASQVTSTSPQPIVTLGGQGLRRAGVLRVRSGAALRFLTELPSRSWSSGSQHHDI